MLDTLVSAIGLWHSIKANLASALEALSWALQSLVGLYHANEGHDLLEIIPIDVTGVVNEVLGPFGQALLDLLLVCEVIRERRLLMCRLRSRNCIRPTRTGTLTSPAAPCDHLTFSPRAIPRLSSESKIRPKEMHIHWPPGLRADG